MNLEPYPSYRQVNLPWLGQVPTHWEVKRLKRIFRVANGATPSSSIPGYWDGDIPWITPEDLGLLHGSNVFEGRRSITKKGYESCGATVVPAGSLVLSTRAPIGHLAIAGAALCTNQGCHSLVLRQQHERRYFYYSLLASKAELQSRGTGTTFQELGKSSLQDLPLAVPPLPEQRAIADFLDRETAKIDALIAKKERLLELLAEKRAAVISHAATKGLDPTVQMKDAGVPGLGPIPNHWEKKRLKYLLARPVTDGPHETPLFVSDGFPFLSVDSIQDGELVFEDCRYISAIDHARYRQKISPETGDILLAKAASTGKIAQVKVDFEFSIWSPLAVIRLDIGRADLTYMEYLLKSKGLQDQIDLYCNSNTQKNISMQDIPNLVCVVPPLAEQRAISEKIAESTSLIGALAARIDEAVDHLREHRAALISAAVTGKIKVN